MEWFPHDVGVNTTWISLGPYFKQSGLYIATLFNPCNLEAPNMTQGRDPDCEARVEEAHWMGESGDGLPASLPTPHLGSSILVLWVQVVFCGSTSWF